MELKPKLQILSFFATAILLAGPLSAAEVYRWVDEKGEVHYSETLPPDFEDKGHDVLNRSGIVVDEDMKLTPEPPPPPSKEDRQELPRDKSGLPRPKALYSEAELQRRMDNFLMLRYESEQEIIDAMNVEIKQLAYDRRLLETTRNSMQDSYRGEIRQAANRQRSGETVDQKTFNEIDKLRSGLASNESELNSLIAREQSIRDEFGAQLERYQTLEKEWAEETGDS
ncbi:MAG: DUF4124 domain-containing protein [Xanthomonadales bacterium]|nr:DUF4124 domain-containing protein [Gammaproteobacteria bacterium]MBT8054236.1 DUF4124 domain-containing protein [Gammaproteobacteria bacterium]NND57571.1 DUF4124 domain-containing protein [Xanthomonadales bacterium]NNK51295.1 DUF4124 domain-containing protein [Xanthomonadales bacterium]